MSAWQESLVVQAMPRVLQWDLELGTWGEVEEKWSVTTNSHYIHITTPKNCSCQWWGEVDLDDL